MSRRIANTINAHLLILLVLNLLSKLALLNWNAAEYTDSVFYLSIDCIGKSKWLPVFPALVQITHLFVRDLIYCGRITSIVMSTASILPFYAIVKRIYSKKAAAFATWLYIVAPVITRWSIRSMTESTFIFFLLLSLWFFTRWYDNRNGIYAAGVIACSGIAAVTRPEGIGLLPMALAFIAYLLYRQRLRMLFWAAIGLIPWMFQIFWHWQVVGRYGYGQELEGGIKKLTIGKFFSYVALYPAHLPYIITPIVFALVVYGIYRSIRSRSEDNMPRLYSFIFLCIFVIWLLGLSLHWAWTTRFMFPIVGLSLIFAGYGISCIKSDMVRRTAFAASILTSVAFTILVLICSRATFGDIRKSAYFIRDEVPAAAEIVSSEITKIEFWSGRDVGKYDRSKLKPGMYVALQNVYCDFEWEMDNLKREYNFLALYRNEGTIIPILADDMYMKPVKRKDGTMGQRGSANHLISPRTQFSKHRFESVVLLIKEKRVI